MKRSILALILLLSISTAFSQNAIVDLFYENINILAGIIVFITVFGIAMGAGSIWFDNPSSITLVALGISLALSGAVILIPELSSIVSQALAYFPIFFAIFIIFALIMTIIFTKGDTPKGKTIKGVAIALLIAALAIIIYLNQWIDLGSIIGGNPSSSMGAGWLWLLLPALAIFIGLIVFYKVRSGGSTIGTGAGTPLSAITGIKEDDPRNVKVILVKKENIGGKEILTAIASELGVKIKGNDYDLNKEIQLFSGDAQLEISGLPSNYNYWYLETGRFTHTCKIGKTDYNTNISNKSEVAEYKTKKKTRSITGGEITIEKKFLNKYNLLLIIDDSTPVLSLRDVLFEGKIINNNSLPDNLKIKFKNASNEYETEFVKTPSQIVLNSSVVFKPATFTEKNNASLNLKGILWYDKKKFKIEIENVSGDLTGCEITLEQSGNIYTAKDSVALTTFTILAAQKEKKDLIIDFNQPAQPAAQTNECIIDLTVKDAKDNPEENVLISCVILGTNNLLLPTQNTNSFGKTTFKIPNPQGAIDIYLLKGNDTDKRGEIKKNFTLSSGVIPLTITLGAILNFKTMNGQVPAPSKTITASINSSPFDRFFDKNGNKISSLVTDVNGELNDIYINKENANIDFECEGQKMTLGPITNGIHSIPFNLSAAPSNDTKIDVNVSDAFNFGMDGVTVSLFDNKNVQVKNGITDIKTSNHVNYIYSLPLINNIPVNGWKDYIIRLTKNNFEFNHKLSSVLKQGQNYFFPLKLNSAIKIAAKQAGSDIKAEIVLPQNTFMDDEGKYIINSNTSDEIFFNNPLKNDTEILVKYENIEKKITIKKNYYDNPLSEPIEFPTQLKVVIIEKDPVNSGKYKVVSKDDNVTYGQQCIQYSAGKIINLGNKYDVSRDPHNNYFHIDSKTDFYITFNDKDYKYNKNLIISDDVEQNCKLGNSSFDHFSGTEQNIDLTINTDIVTNNFGINQTLFDKKYNYLVILREENFKSKATHITVMLRNPLGQPINQAKVTITNKTHSAPSVPKYDNGKDIPVADCITNVDGKFECYLDIGTDEFEISFEKGALEGKMYPKIFKGDPGKVIIWP